MRAETLVERGFSLLLQNTHRICELHVIAGFQTNGTAKHLDSSVHKGQYKQIITSLESVLNSSLQKDFVCVQVGC